MEYYGNVCPDFLLGILAYLSKYFDLSGNRKIFWVGSIYTFFMGFYFDYEGLWWVFEIFRVAFLKKG